MNIGKISKIAGPVVDVTFEPGHLPKINHALTVTVKGKDRVMEVAQLVGNNTAAKRKEYLHKHCNR